MTINASEEDERSRWALSIFENQVYNESHSTWSNVSFFFGVMCLFHYNVLIYKFWTIAWPHGVSGRMVGIPWSSMPDTGWLLINAMCSYHCFHLTERNWQIVWCIKLQSRYWSKKKIQDLWHNCIHLTLWQSNAQNSPSQLSTVYEPWTSRCSCWI